MMSAVFSIIIIGLIILFFVSLFTYISRKVLRASQQNGEITAMNRKLDRVIALLEEKEESKK